MSRTRDAQVGRTNTIKGSLHPEWNEYFDVFVDHAPHDDKKSEELAQSGSAADLAALARRNALRFEIRSKKTLGSDTKLGEVLLEDTGFEGGKFPCGWATYKIRPIPGGSKQDLSKGLLGVNLMLKGDPGWGASAVPAPDVAPAPEGEGE